MSIHGNDRPFWMTQDDPKWCRSKHNPAAELGDRECWSDGFEVPLSHLTGAHHPDGSYEPEGLLLNLMQGWREVEPHIDLGSIQGTLINSKLTLSEAERLAFILTKLVDIARGESYTVSLDAGLDEMEEAKQ